MFDYNAQTETVKKLIDEAALMRWCFIDVDEMRISEERKKSRATRDIVRLNASAGRYRGELNGMRRVLATLLGVSKREIDDAIATRSLVLFG